MKSIFDRSFHYTPAAATDIRKTFRRIRAELKAKDSQQTAKNQDGVAAKVVTLKPR